MVLIGGGALGGCLGVTSEAFMNGIGTFTGDDEKAPLPLLQGQKEEMAV